MCNGIDFGIRDEEDPNTIRYYTKAKRDTRRPKARPVWADSDLVISDSKHHSATKLCESNTSLGPDFAHVGESLFCDMDSKILYPFCGENDSETCFNLESLALENDENISALSADDTESSHYSRALDWRRNISNL